MRCFVVLLLLLTSPAHDECLKIKNLAHVLREAEFKPIKMGHVGKLPFIVLIDRHGREVMVVFPAKHMACIMPVTGA